jgi:hypothetical protein
MTSPTVTESPAALEPVCSDPFLEDLGGAHAHPTPERIPRPDGPASALA